MAAAVSGVHVSNACSTAEQRDKKLLASISSSKDAYVQLAGAMALNGLDMGEQMDELKAGLEKLIKLQAEVEAHTRALQTVGNQPQPPAAPAKSDYKALVQGHIAADEQLRNFTTEGHPWLVELQAELGEEVEPQQDDQELGSDDDLIETGGTAFPAMNCLITQKPLLDIDDPVEDNLHYVYERTAIEDYINKNMRRGDAADHPMGAGCPPIRKAHLKPCKKVKKEQRRVRMGLPSILKPAAANIGDVLTLE